MDMSDIRARVNAIPRDRVIIYFSQKVLEVQRIGAHLDLTILPGPLLSGAVSVQLQTQSIRIGQVERFTDSMIRKTLKGPIMGQQSFKHAGESLAIRKPYGDMKETTGLRRLRP